MHIKKSNSLIKEDLACTFFIEVQWRGRLINEFAWLVVKMPLYVLVPGKPTRMYSLWNKAFKLRKEASKINWELIKSRYFSFLN
jgi:hypothetical protein